MKYMGSKRAMLTNGLGQLLHQALSDRSRFVDLFAGSGAVSKFVASRYEIPVFATDLQQYSVCLTGSVIHRTKAISTDLEWEQWVCRAQDHLEAYPELLSFAEALAADCGGGEASRDSFVATITAIRVGCSELPSAFPLSRAYGGHYFGLSQALWLDALRATVPTGDLNEVAIAALIESASECSASPGHTAQPFSPTESGLPHILNAWRRDLLGRTKKYFDACALLHAKKVGRAYVADAVEQTSFLNETDLVFLDPPYSEVQYSRFYHVLESVATGKAGEVSGIGRYPKLEDRPQSSFSRKQPAREEFNNLMVGVASMGAHALVTFPAHAASNGLSGELVEQIAGQYFSVERRAVKSTFSTLGGTGATRSARQGATELILHLIPK
ncbi:MAG: DNA adenine methylase [Pseudomonadota bacterium]